MHRPIRLDLLLDGHAATIAEKPAFYFRGETLSYHAVADRSRRLANALTRAGAGPGDRICYLGKNHPAFFDLLFACSRLGCVAVPLNWRLAPAEISRIVKDAEARLLFVDATFVGLAATFGIRAISVDDVAGIETLAAWLRDHPGEHVGIPQGADAPVLQLYTSGTTGRPKGVMISQRNLLEPRALAQDGKVEWDVWHPDDVSLIAMPFCHVSGTVCALMGLYHGASAVILPAFDPGETLAAIADYKATKIFVVPTALQMLVDMARSSGATCKTIREIFYGASPIPESILREAMEVFDGAAFAQQYGLTETAGGAVLLPSGDHQLPPTPRMSAAGKPMPGVEIRIADSVRPGDVGEVLIRSPANMLGYWRLPDETARAIDGEGWLHTGDAGYLDADGYLYLHDRVKDMIVSGGENVYPAEIESVLFDHPDVDQVAVIGVPDLRWGETPKALVVLKPGCKPDAAAMLIWARDRLAGYKLPSTIEFRDDLPRTASGKVMRRQLREPHWAGHIRRIN